MDIFWNYQAVQEVQYRSELGWYVTYGIRASKKTVQGWEWIEWVHDVTTDRRLAGRLAETFRRYQLSPVHLREAILDKIP